MGIEIDAPTYAALIAQERLAPICIALLVGGLLVVFFAGWQRSREARERQGKALEQVSMFGRQQNILNALLSIAFKDLSLEEALERCLDELLSAKWLPLRCQGGIFLIEDDPQVLELKAQRNLAAQTRSLCVQVPSGRCLCGRALASGQLQFADHLDERHQIRYEEMPAHGHYCVPIRSGSEVLGVIVLYLPAGHARCAVEQRFLEAAASAIAALVKRKRSENALRTSEEKYRLLVENLPQKVFYKNKDLAYVSCNHHYATDLNIAPEQIAGKTDYDFYPKELAEKYRADDRMVMEKGETREIEEEYIKEGQEFVVQTVKTPVRDAEGKVIGILGIFWDVTERKQAEAKLEAMHKELLDISRQAGMAEIASGVLHNVGNVLNSVNVSAEVLADQIRRSKVSGLGKAVGLLQQHADDLATFISADPKGKQVPVYLVQLSEHLASEQAAVLSELKRLADHVEHIKSIVTTQQAYARRSTMTEPVDLQTLVEDALRINVSSFARYEIEVIRDYGQLPRIVSDRQQLLQILINLVRNAKHALRDSTVRPKHLVVRTRSDGDGQVQVQVIDNGVGIAPENMPRIFTYGFTTKKNGHGFGLHHSALVAKEMGGSLSVHSDGVGRGAVFTLELPLEVETESAEGPSSLPQDGPGGSASVAAEDGIGP